MSAFRFGPASSWHSLRQLIPSASYVNCGNISFREVATHAEHCGPGVLFVPLAGSLHLQAEFLKSAAQRGVSGILTDFPLPDLPVPQGIVRDVRHAHGWLVHGMAQYPSKQLETVGVTGTNGKTTITWMLRSIWKAAGIQAGLLGTIEYDDGVLPPSSATLTTPAAATLAEWMQRMVRQGTSRLAMEVSSHALQQQRLAGVALAAAVFTNVTQDHLDYHGTFEAYLAAKLRLLDYLKPGAPVVLNGDDPTLRGILTDIQENYPCRTVGFTPENDVRIHVKELRLNGSTFEIHAADFRLLLEIPVPGAHNLMNAALAATLACELGLSSAAIQQGLRWLAPPPGRMQRVSREECPFDCFVDYAHTPDAIRQVLSSLRPLVTGRLICVFGAGGGRDREKRPEMARAALLADLIVLTSDNSRNEPTEQILRDITAGFPASRTPDRIAQDRAEAIDWAIQQAQPGDCVLILGKGHETGQQIGLETIEFNDVQQTQASIDRHNSLHSCLPKRISA